MNTNMHFWMFWRFCVCPHEPVVHLLPYMNLLFPICMLVLSMFLNVLNEDCILLCNLNGNKLQISLLLLFMQWNRQFCHQFQSSQVRNYKYLNSKPTFSFILQKPQMLQKEGNRFWEEGLPYGKKVQEKSKHRIKHMEKCLHGINQVSLMEVIFGLSWLLFMSLTSNCLHLIFYQCWGKRKKCIKMKLQENKKNVPEWRNFSFFVR